MNRKVFIRLVIIAGGIGIILLSLFAFQLGLDNDPGWGPRRIQLIIIGLSIILFGSLYWLTPKFVRHAESVTNLEDKNIVGLKARPANTLINNILLTLLFFFTICIYIWIITIGRIDKWPSGRDYYWKLTQAFQHGQTYLLEEPNPQLAQLENPYDHHQRKELEYLWDTTYYDGKYFLYWGPAPAALGVFVTAITSKPVTDTGLVFSFVIGIALFSILLLYEIYKKFQLPAWALWSGVFVSAINVPLIWLLTRPTFYEVSISGGQFFLMAGFYFLFLGFRNSSLDRRWISASALTLGLAGATRINLLPSIIVLAFIAAWKIYAAQNKNFRKALPALVSLFLPLGLIAIALCGYNYARFGSIFEFGHRYQLTGPSLTADYADISSPKYILPNTFTYIFRLPSLNAEFPFFTVPWIKENMWPAFIHLPEHYYYTEPVAGILFVIPLIGFAALLLARLFWLFINGDISRKQFVDAENSTNDSANLFSWFGFTLLAYTLIQLFILLIFINSAMRYLADVAPALIILSAMFVGYYVKAVDTNWLLRRAIAWLWVAASALTVIFGLLIGFTGDKNNFLNQNPALYYLLSEWFTR
ncbi:MAG: hypothetical protein LC108_02265 [Anaerolineales bacterium]|nr:hypothetical protein [Anaerolineales bacterium]